MSVTGGGCGVPVGATAGDWADRSSACQAMPTASTKPRRGGPDPAMRRSLAPQTGLHNQTGSSTVLKNGLVLRIDLKITCSDEVSGMRGSGGDPEVVLVKLGFLPALGAP